MIEPLFQNKGAYDDTSIWKTDLVKNSEDFLNELASGTKKNFAQHIFLKLLNYIVILENDVYKT